jgi:hypothetical protein
MCFILNQLRISVYIRQTYKRLFYNHMTRGLKIHLYIFQVCFYGVQIFKQIFQGVASTKFVWKNNCTFFIFLKLSCIVWYVTSWSFQRPFLSIFLPFSSLSLVFSSLILSVKIPLTHWFSLIQSADAQVLKHFCNCTLRYILHRQRHGRQILCKYI